MQLEFRGIGYRIIRNDKGLIRRLVVPARIIEAHLKERRHGQQPEFSVKLYIDTLPGCLLDIERISHIGHHFVEIGIPHHHLRVKNPVHVGGCGQNLGIQSGIAAAHQDRSVRPFHLEFLALQNDMLIRFREKRQQFPVPQLFLSPIRVERVEFLPGQRKRLHRLPDGFSRSDRFQPFPLLRLLCRNPDYAQRLV
ncbi:hypothetical protein D3C71_1551590 [compost metagenome]